MPQPDAVILTRRRKQRFRTVLRSRPYKRERCSRMVSEISLLLGSSVLSVRTAAHDKGEETNYAMDSIAKISGNSLFRRGRTNAVERLICLRLLSDS